MPGAPWSGGAQQAETTFMIAHTVPRFSEPAAIGSDEV